MPTGYTMDVENGQSFENFVLGCARAFGACIAQRDAPLSERPAPQEVSPYYLEALEKAQKELETLLSVESPVVYGTDFRQKEIEHYDSQIQRHEDTILKYAQMRQKVLEWTPPSKDHVELKRFMLDQLDQNHDFSGFYRNKLKEALLTTPLEYYEAQLSEARRSVEYHTKKLEEEGQRVQSRNNWIEELYRSLEEWTFNDI